MENGIFWWGLPQVVKFMSTPKIDVFHKCRQTQSNSVCTSNSLSVQITNLGERCSFAAQPNQSVKHSDGFYRGYSGHG